MEDIEIDYLVTCENDSFIISSNTHSLVFDQIYYIKICNPAKFDEQYGRIKEIKCLGGIIYKS